MHFRYKVQLEDKNQVDIDIFDKVAYFNRVLLYGIFNMGIGLSQFRKYAGAAGAALLALTPAGVARADDVAQGARVELVEAVPRGALTPMAERLEAEEAAMDYAKANPAIGIVVLGSTIDEETGQRVGPEFIGAWLKEQFSRQGREAEVFTGWETHQGFAVKFAVGELLYGPYSGNDLEEGFNTALIRQKQAWPDTYAEARLDR